MRGFLREDTSHQDFCGSDGHARGAGCPVPERRCLACGAAVPDARRLHRRDRGPVLRRYPVPYGLQRDLGHPPRVWVPGDGDNGAEWVDHRSLPIDIHLLQPLPGDHGSRLGCPPALHGADAVVFRPLLLLTGGIRGTQWCTT